MIRTARSLPALVLVCLSTACASGGATSDPGRPPVLLGLPGVVDSVRNSAPLDRTHWGVGAYDRDADRMLLRVNLDRHFVPASNTKLVVSAVALDLLGPDFRYTTTIHARDLRDGTASALVVRGTGDPTLGARFHGDMPMAALANLADSVVASGVRRVEGPLVIDATYFGDQTIHPTWEIGDLDWYYAAPVAAFAVEEGTVVVLVLPGASVGAPARIDVISPQGVVSVVNGVTTDTAFSENTVDFTRAPGTNEFRFFGSIPLNAEPDDYVITVHDPARYAGHALRGLLAQRNIEFTDSVIVLDWRTGALPAEFDVTTGGYAQVAALESPRMADIVEAILEPSNNWIAEQVLKTLGAEHGAEGTWREGVAVERRWLIDQAEVDSAAFHLVDGSGLSAQNLLSPDAIMRLLYHAGEQDWGPTYRAALAEPGEEGSTLANRLSAYQGRVFAKTGSITHVNSLSGYLVAADGRQIIFSVLSNGSGVSAAAVRAGIDRIVTGLAEVGAAPAVPAASDRRLAP
jgi:D-alanyl-D-alanine carboxypeptidase/D-alanyl-D-alanine-endopeptidase (penicillin-binding protein 4)